MHNVMLDENHLTADRADSQQPKSLSAYPAKEPVMKDALSAPNDTSATRPFMAGLAHLMARDRKQDQMIGKVIYSE
jgi:hypothetical protein